METKYTYGYEKTYSVKLFKPENKAKRFIVATVRSEREERKLLKQIQRSVKQGFIVIEWRERWDDGIPF